MEFNFSLVLGFLIWSAFCLVLIVATRIGSNYWKQEAEKFADQVELCEHLLNESCNIVDVIADGYGAGGEKIDRKLMASGFQMYLAEEWPCNVEIIEEDEPIWARSIPKGVITHPGNLQERCDILSELPCDSK